MENGDRDSGTEFYPLSQAEFEQRYNQLPHIKKAELELVEGVIYMASPVRARQLRSKN
ncbi:MAG: hypothetical protein F6K22_26015 [Okeania sp. SIO2F4]|nr:hypothetical protein [Okeania sp. SIO2F4]